LPLSVRQLGPAVPLRTELRSLCPFLQEGALLSPYFGLLTLWSQTCSFSLTKGNKLVFCLANGLVGIPARLCYSLCQESVCPNVSILPLRWHFLSFFFCVLNPPISSSHNLAVGLKTLYGHPLPPFVYPAASSYPRYSSHYSDPVSLRQIPAGAYWHHVEVHAPSRAPVFFLFSPTQFYYKTVCTGHYPVNHDATLSTSYWLLEELVCIFVCFAN